MPSLPQPGVCPSRKYKPGMCARIRFVSCADDSDCANNEKCCNNGCGLKCMAPVTAKPGVCPIRYYKKPMCDNEFCADDGDCPNNEKCCNTGCGHECMPPVSGIIYYTGFPRVLEILESCESEKKKRPWKVFENKLRYRSLKELEFILCKKISGKKSILFSPVR
ncbi:hypothetical protein PO909_013484 [Leuciscus waleckii]